MWQAGHACQRQDGEELVTKDSQGAGPEGTVTETDRVDMAACTCKSIRSIQHTVHSPVNKVKT